MKINYIISLIILVLFTIFAQAAVKSIKPQEVLKLLQNKQAPLILDVRSEQEFIDGHIEGAVNISYDLLIEKNEALTAYKERDIIVYCRSGRRTQIAYKILQEQGFTKLIDLNGHLILWNKRNYPLIKGK